MSSVTGLTVTTITSFQKKMFRRKYFIITVKGGKSQYSANKKKKCVTFRLKYNEVV